MQDRELTPEEKEYWEKGVAEFLANPDANASMPDMPFEWSQWEVEAYSASLNDGFNVAFCNGYNSARDKYFNELGKLGELKAELRALRVKYKLDYLSVDEIRFMSYPTNLYSSEEEDKLPQ